jgi:hypothetical protein
MLFLSKFYKVDSTTRNLGRLGEALYVFSISSVPYEQIDGSTPPNTTVVDTTSIPDSEIEKIFNF